MNMCLNLVVHQKEMNAKTVPVEWPITTESYIQSRESPRDGVFHVVDISYRGIPVIGIRRRDGMNVIWMMLTCHLAWTGLEIMRLLPSEQ